MYRQPQGSLEVLLVHPGGPFWAKKDAGSWSIPKGEFEPGEEPLEVARREFEEETGVKSSGGFMPLTPQKQPGGKIIFAWTFEGDCDVSAIKSKRSPWNGLRVRRAAAVSRGGSCELGQHSVAKEKNSERAEGFIDELEDKLSKLQAHEI
jgi:predicted NUDIX family NTP pyrophosphohydrolase